MSQPIAHVQRDRDGSVTVASPWVAGRTPDLIARWKHTIPAAYRQYDPERRAWRFAVQYADVALRLAAEAFTLVYEDAQEHAAPGAAWQRQPCAATRHYAALHLRSTAPPEIVGAAYRPLVNLHPPDRLPASQRDAAHQAMVTINVAYAALAREGRA